MYDIVIVGAGTAGLSAALYGVRAGFSALILEQSVYGGQIINAPHVFNYPGIQTTSGVDFVTGLYEQATMLGAEIAYENALSIAPKEGGFTVTTGKRAIDARAVILATGAKNRPLGIAREQELIGYGISYCATCDGAFYRDKTVAVVGGGNTAVEDAMFLAGYCSKVYLIHRRDAFRADGRTVRVVEGNAKIEFVLDSVVTELKAGSALEGIVVQNVKTNELRELAVEGLFVAVGQQPENAAFSPPVALDDRGYIVAGEDCRTNVPGIFTAGDCRTKTVRQLVTAASDGAVAALAAAEYIKTRGA